MDILAILVGIGLGGGAYMTTGAVTGRVILSKLLSEEKFHLTRRGKSFFIASGRRRDVLTIAEVPAYEKELRRIKASAVFKWPNILLGLYRPFQEKEGEIVGTLRAKAIESQRNRLGVQLMERKLENHPIMTRTYEIETDEAFKIVRDAIQKFDRIGRIELSEAQLLAISPKEEEATLTVLYPRRQSAISASSANPATVGEHTEGLPAGYVWRYNLEKGVYEKLVISVENLSTGKTMVAEGFYTHIWNTKPERRTKTREIKKKLILLLESKIDPDAYKNRVLEDII